MAISKTYKMIEWKYIHRYAGGFYDAPIDRSRTVTYPIAKVSDVTQIKEQLEAYISSGELGAFKKLLESDFIIKDLEKTQRSGGLHTDNSREQQGDFYIKRLYVVRPVFEQLLLTEDASVFKALLKTAEDKQPFVEALKALFPKLGFANDEGIKFNFDISGASFVGAKLGCSRFYNVEGVNFDKADLRYTEMSQEVLDQSHGYANAKLPQGLWHWWDESVLEGIKQRVDAIQNYTKNHIPKADAKFKAINDFYQQQIKVLKAKRQPTSIEKKTMLEGLKDLRQKTDTHRSLSYLIGEAISFIMLAVVGYLAVSTYRKIAHGHFGIFSQPKSNLLVENAQHFIVNRG